MQLNLKDKVGIITGPAKGMGAAVTRAFALEGARLALIGRDTVAIEPVATEARAIGAEAIVIPCDLTDAKQCDAAATKAKAAFGRIDFLVNVAGGSGPVGKTGVETTPEEFDDIVTLNMNGCFHTMRSVLPRRGITKSFALEVGSYNINVNCVAPGMVDGPRFRDKVCADMAKRLGITVEEAAKRHAADYALKRITLDEDVANACLFLASDVSRQITGVDLPVDGGWAML
jgi:NAD(P)-dependent dehydrogenase (short-subunit alcohol dehydrogenase family)